MKCVFCKVGETQPQRVTEVCGYCNEEYYQAEDWAAVEHLMEGETPPPKVTRIPVYALGA